MQDATQIIKFWFVEHNKDDWFSSKPEFDDRLRQRFFNLHPKVAAGEMYNWRATAQGRLAEIMVLDQFSRQFYRDRAQAFATDGMALVLAQELVRSGGDLSLTDDQRVFAYMPYMHSESLIIHDEAVRLFTRLGIEGNLNFEIAHREIIVRFGRFPKRNEALGRTSTKDELAYIEERGGSMF